MIAGKLVNLTNAGAGAIFKQGFVPQGDHSMSRLVSLYDAKTKLSSLVERAAAGEEIVITKNGRPRARLVPIPFKGKRRSPAGAMAVTFLAEDFDAPDPRIEALFAGER